MYFVDKVYVVFQSESRMLTKPRVMIESVWSSAALAEAAIRLHEEMNPDSKYDIAERILNTTIKE